MASERERKKEQARRSSAREWAEEKTQTFERTAVQVPEGICFWKPDRADIYKLDVIPYMTGEGNRRADQGMEHFERTFWLHKVPGIDGRLKYYCCLAENFRKPCPICQYLNREGGRADPDLIMQLRNQQRLLMNVIDITTAESKAKGIQVLDQPYGTAKHPFFGQILKNKIVAVQEYADFWLLEGGYTLYCTTEPANFPKGSKAFNITNVEMVRRKKDYGDDIMHKAVCLDDCLIAPSFETLQKALNPNAGESEQVTEEGTGDELDQEVEETPPKTQRPHPVASRNHQTPTPNARFKTGDLVMYKGQEMEVESVNKDGSLELEWQNPKKGGEDKTFSDVDPAKVQPWTGKEEEPARPPTKSASSVAGDHRASATTKSPSDDEDEEEEEESEFDSDLEPEEDEETGEFEEESEEEDDEESEFDNEEEDKAPPPRKGPGRPKRPA